MSRLLGCGICCMIISIWGTIQLYPSELVSDLLFIMGICYKYEVVTLLEDVEEEEYDDYDDFILKTQNNYAATSRNCFIAAGIYVVFIIVSYGCIKTARHQIDQAEKRATDDHLFCLPKPPPKTDPKKVL